MEITEKMNKEKGNPNSQPAQGQLLSMQGRMRVRGEAERRGQCRDRAATFALPKEPSPSHASSSSFSYYSSLMPIKLPPVHLGQPKVGPRKPKHLKVPQVQLRQPQAVPQDSWSQALPLCGDRLPPLPHLPVLSPLTPLPCQVSPRDAQSRGTELQSTGEKKPQPCSPSAWQPYTPVPRVFLPPLWAAQEGTARVSPSWQLLPVLPIPSGARAMERSLTGMALERQNNDNELSHGENGSDKELSPKRECIEFFRGDSKSDQELSPVEDDSELFPVDSTSDQELSPVEEAMVVVSGDSTSDQELSPVEEAMVVVSGDGPTDEELSKVEETGEVDPEDSTSDRELSKLEEAIKPFPGENSNDEKLSPVEGDNEFSQGDSKSYKELSLGEEKPEKELSPGLSDSDKELSQGVNYEDERLSPADVKHKTELWFGEDYGVLAMSPWEENDNKRLSHWEEQKDEELCSWEQEEDEELSHWEEHKDEELSYWEECEDEELTRRALLGGMDSNSNLSPKLPVEKVSRHQMVLEWLEAHFPNNYGAEEEEEKEADRQQELSHVKKCEEKVEAHWQELLDSVSALDFNVSDNVHSKGVPVVSQGDEAIQNNIWNKPLGLVDDKDPREGPSCSRQVDTEVAAKSACADEPSASPALWGPTGAKLAAAEEEEPPKPLGPEVTEAQSQGSEKRPSHFRRALQGPFRCPSLLRGPIRCPSLVRGPFRCPSLVRRPFRCPSLLRGPFRCPSLLWRPFRCPSLLRRPFRCPSLLRGPFRCPSLLRGPFRCPSLALGLFWCPCMAAQPEE
ncbi:nestin-like [Haemorhous mexicanus]|uniref:nestin-like n=1 Tax=Haemorhous mexicanus TaxID=30427 RepID=UPI0028BE0C85|nr:nestin-like [Haemorhous mexicanus]